MQYAIMRNALHFLLPLPVHPQWLSYRQEKETRRWAGERAEGTVLDIGCAASLVRTCLKDTCRYIGLDYYRTAVALYRTTPHVYGDAQSLPVKTASIDSVLLLDVLEHLPQPEKSIAEIRRVLKKEGKLILQIPFLYPLHDEPFDFQRLTIHGLKELLERNGFSLQEVLPLGRPLVTCALLVNLAFSRTALEWFKRKNPLAITVIFLPFFSLFINLFAWLLTSKAKDDGLMPHSYRLFCLKKEEAP